ncbi:MAG: LuxR family transcriptional regulator, partial [Chloroflexi bacterium]|nr:LuxR family transcriptional regulator [Chloroflexota bacterium]
MLNRCARIRDLGHGGQTLLSTATRELVVDALPDGVTLVDRGLHRLRGLARPEHVWEVRPAGIAEEFPTLRSVGARPGNLPAELDPFIGRAVEQADLIRLLTAERLVTLTGAGGCGKTRLAIRVAAGVQDRFEGGVWFADLARVTEADELVGFVAGIVDADPALGRSAVDSIAAKLAGSPSLLLLDNCEHVVGAAAALVESLVGAATGLAVLTTSREPLGVPGEVAWRVPSLSTPDAVALFADRGARVRPGFVVEAELVDVVASICERLDGIPLAIELAAARVRAMSPASIAAGIADRFRLLVGGDRAVPRHRTLAASVEWSHSLLSDSEKALLRRL